MDTCTKCLKPCPDHGITFCATCHTHEGECSFGDCEDETAFRLVWTEGAGEVRNFCRHHGTDPAFQFARSGATLTPLEGTS